MAQSPEITDKQLRSAIAKHILLITATDTVYQQTFGSPALASSSPNGLLGLQHSIYQTDRARSIQEINAGLRRLGGMTLQTVQGGEAVAYSVLGWHGPDMMNPGVQQWAVAGLPTMLPLQSQISLEQIRDSVFET